METIDQIPEERVAKPGPEHAAEPAAQVAERPRAGAQLALARVATALAAVSTGALAIGAFAVGALAIRTLVVRALRVQRSRFGRVVVDELEIGRLVVRNLPRPRGRVVAVARA